MPQVNGRVLRESFLGLFGVLAALGCANIIGIKEKSCNNCRIISLAASSTHACAVTEDGRVWCWGDNANGELGRGTPITGVPSADGLLSEGAKPVSWIDGPPPRFRSVTVGELHTCAVTDSSTVYCWGSNIAEQLGVPSQTEQVNSAPALVHGLPEGVVSVTAGFGHTCALVAPNGTQGAKSVWCWGANYLGQCGTPGGASSTTAPRADLGHLETLAPMPPTQVSGLPSNISEVKAIKHTTCALTNEGLFCWGGNRGANPCNPNDSCDPSVTCGQDCILGLTDGGGQLGPGAKDLWFSESPVPIALDGSVLSFSLGPAAVFAITGGSDLSTVSAWGSNVRDNLGVGAASDGGSSDTADPDDPTPKKVLARDSPVLLSGVRKLLSSEGSDQCVVMSAATTSSRIQCWGSNDWGELGCAERGGRFPDASDLFLADEFSLNAKVDVDPSLFLFARGDDFGCLAAAHSAEVWCWGRVPWPPVHRDVGCNPMLIPLSDE